MGSRRPFHTVVEDIGKLIDDGVYPPGMRLPGERELATFLGVSRVAIREAKIALQAVGRLEARSGSAFYVSARQPLFSSIGTGAAALEVLEASMLIEADLAALVARTITDEGLMLLEDLLVPLGSANPEVAAAADRQFHILIAEQSDNQAMMLVVKFLSDMRSQITVQGQSLASTAGIRSATHRAILKAFRDRDPKAARKATRAHFQDILEWMLGLRETEALRDLEKRISATRERISVCSS